MRQNILLYSLILLLLSMVSSSLPVFGIISLDLDKDDEVTVQSTIESDSDSEFVYIIQIEDQEGYTVFLDFHEDSVASDISQTLIFAWRAESEGTYSVKTFILSSFENPILLDSFVRDLRIDVNEENKVACTGSAECFTGIVTNIVDGDTIDVGDIRIRLALVDTPETFENRYQEANDFTSDLCPVGSQVLVDQDDSQLVDRYGRMLAKVTCGDNENLNAELLYNEHAVISTEYCAESEFSFEDWAQEYGCASDDQEETPAVNNAPSADAGGFQSVDEETLVTLDGTGSWDFEGDNLSYSWEQTDGPAVSLRNAHTATPYFTAPFVDDLTILEFMLTVNDGYLTATDSVTIYVDDVPEEDSISSPEDEAEECDPSYPTVCIPPPPPDLDCDEIPYQDFEVLEPDPHRFDGDNDGIGCES